MNTGRFGATNRDIAFIDLMRGAHISIDRYRPADIVRNTEIPLDSNKYPTAFGVDIEVLFYSNETAGAPYQTLPAGRYVVMWDGPAVDPLVTGSGVSDVVVTNKRIEFSLDTTFDNRAVFSYQNGGRTAHVRNIRIVPAKYEEHYRYWSWSNYSIGASTNPPIFFPGWLEKMSVACTIRYVNSLQTTDANVIHFERDSTKTRISPSNSVWYDGFKLGSIAEPKHIWPWELIVEATLQTATIPWINFRVYSYENILKNDKLVQQVAALFHTHYGGLVYVEYGNEIWNYGWPFTIATRHVEKNGPGRNQDLNENYALRSNLVQKTFADAYGDDSCLAIGVLGTQARNPWVASQRMMHADLDYIDVLSPGAYIGDSITPDANAWPFLMDLSSKLVDGTINEAVAFSTIKEELLTGRNGAIHRNWEQDLGLDLKDHAEIADSYGVCLAFYESGFHMRVDKINYLDREHFDVSEMIRRYRKSVAQRDVEKRMYDEMSAVSTGPMIPYTNFSSAGNGAFAYWDSIFQEPDDEDPRTQLIREYNDPRNDVYPLITRFRNQLKSAGLRAYRSKKKRLLVFAKLRDVEKAVRKRNGITARTFARQLNARINGCGRRPDGNDFVSDCRIQKRLQRTSKSLRDVIEELPRRRRF